MAEHVTEKYFKKLLGKNDIEAVLQRLDRLTMESKMAIPEILDVIHDLSNNVNVVMEGAHRLII
jgi:hypothetical protein